MVPALAQEAPSAVGLNRSTDVAAEERLLFEELTADQAKTVANFLGPSNDPIPEWDEEEVVLVCWKMLKRVYSLADPDASISEKLSIAAWIFTEPEKDALPFSFAFCINAVSLSPLSPIEYIGSIPVDDLRDTLRVMATRSIRQSIGQFPPAVQEAFRADPEQIMARLERDSQYLNKQCRRFTSPGLFD